MKKTYSVEANFNDMRIDRWIRNKFGEIPQSLIEKNLRSGNIKLNKKKIKSSIKVRTDDQIDLFNIEQLCNHSTDWFGQMSSICLPNCDVLDLYRYLKSENIEIPIMEWNKKKILRISIQAYNSEKDIDKLITSLKNYFKL